MRNRADSLTSKNLIITLLSFSPLCIFIAWDSSFNMQVVFPIMLIVIFWAFSNSVIKKNNSKVKHALYLSAIYFIAIIINLITNPEIINTKSFVRVAYSFLIVFYYSIITSIDFDKNEVAKICSGNFISGIIIGIFIIRNWKNGARGKISMLSIFGEMIEENYTAALLAFNFVLGLLLLFYFDKKIIPKIVTVGGLSIILFSILLTGSRGGLLGLAVGSLIIVIHMAFNSNISLFKKIVFIVFIISVYIFAWKNLEQILPSFLYKRMISNGIDGLNDNSNSQRVALWINALSNYYKHPLFGFGIGNFAYYVSQIYTQHSVVVAHNTYIDTLIDGGIVGFVLTMSLWLADLKLLFFKGRIVFLSLLCTLFITSFILGAERTFFVWNGYFILNIIAKSISQNTEDKNGMHTL